MYIFIVIAIFETLREMYLLHLDTNKSNYIDDNKLHNIQHQIVLFMSAFTL